MKSPVLENCTPGAERGAPDNGRPYLDQALVLDATNPEKILACRGASKTGQVV
jgi:hypothetical protein